MEQIDQAWLHEQAQSISEEDIQRLLKNVEGVTEELGEVEELHELKPEVKKALSMLQEYQDGNFKEISREKVQAVTFALLYLLEPSDGIPDNTPGIGFLDDFAIIVLALELIQDELEIFRTWNREHLKENYHL